MWLRCAHLPDAFELIHSRRISVAGPGKRWEGLSSFLLALAREYDTTQIQFDDSPVSEDDAPHPPRNLGASLLSDLADFPFPQSGCLRVAVFPSADWASVRHKLLLLQSARSASAPQLRHVGSASQATH